jgi:site-specific DNA recombinase
MAAPAPALPRFVEFVRVSSAGQADRDTPQDQRAVLDRLRLSRPGRLVERIETQVSGAAGREERTDLQRLAELSRARAYDELRVRHLDRLSRHADPRERIAVFGMVADAGAVIVDGTGRVIDPRTELGELGYYVETWMASRERARIAERTLAAKRRLAAEGRLPPMSLPWGRTWSRERGWGLDHEAAASYRRLFDLVLRRRTLRQTAAELNSEGLPTPRGRTWTAGTVYNLVAAPHASGRWRSHGSEWRIPPVVDEATQAAALARLRANDLASGRHDPKPTLLRKLLVCGVCGGSLHTDSRTDGGLYYVCRVRPECRRRHRVELVDEAVRAAVAEWARSAGPVAANRGVPDESAEARRDLGAARREVRRLDREEENLLRLLRRGIGSARAHERQIEEVARLSAAAERRAEDAQARIDGAARRAEQAATVEARLASLRAGLERAGPAEWRELLEILVDRAAGDAVVLWPDGRWTLRGALPLDGSGVAALAGAGEPSPPSRTAGQIPVRIEAWAGRRR